MGTLTGSNTVLAGSETFNLSSPAQTDWIQFPQSATSVNRKSGGGSMIGLPTTIGSGVTFTGYTDGPKMTWTDGTPTASATALAGGIYADNTTATGQGIQIVLPADTTSRTLTIYCGRRIRARARSPRRYRTAARPPIRFHRARPAAATRSSIRRRSRGRRTLPLRR